MKKISLTILFSFLLGFIFYGCCDREHRITGSSDFEVLGDNVNSGIVTGLFFLRDNHKIEEVSGIFEGVGLQEANAQTACDLNLVNDVFISRTELYFDQDVSLNGTINPAASNILDNDTFNSHFSLSHELIGSVSYLSIELDSVLFSPPIFTDGPMNIKLVTKTELGLSFESQVDIVVDMN